MDLSGDKGAGKQRAHATAAVFLRLRLTLARPCLVSSVSSFMLLLSFCIYFLNKIILPALSLSLLPIDWFDTGRSGWSKNKLFHFIQTPIVLAK